MNITHDPRKPPEQPPAASKLNSDVIHLTCECLQEENYSISLCGRMEPKNKTQNKEGVDENPLDHICVECESLMQLHVCYEDEDDDDYLFEGLGDA